MDQPIWIVQSGERQTKFMRFILPFLFSYSMLCTLSCTGEVGPGDPEPMPIADPESEPYTATKVILTKKENLSNEATSCLGQNTESCISNHPALPSVSSERIRVSAHVLNVQYILSLPYTDWSWTFGKDIGNTQLCFAYWINTGSAPLDCSRFDWSKNEPKRGRCIISCITDKQGECTVRVPLYQDIHLRVSQGKPWDYRCEWAEVSRNPLVFSENTDLTAPINPEDHPDDYAAWRNHKADLSIKLMRDFYTSVANRMISLMAVDKVNNIATITKQGHTNIDGIIDFPGLAIPQYADMVGFLDYQTQSNSPLIYQLHIAPSAIDPKDFIYTFDLPPDIVAQSENQQPLFIDLTSGRIWSGSW